MAFGVKEVDFLLLMGLGHFRATLTFVK